MEGKATVAREAVAHRSADQHHHRRTWSVLARLSKYTVGANKKTSTPSTSDRSTKTKTTNLNLTQGTKVDAFRTATSYFDKGWNAFAQQKDGSIQWIPEQIVGIGEDFHSQVDDGKVKTTVCRVRWSGYDRTGDTWQPITHLHGYASMVKAFKESHEKDVE